MEATPAATERQNGNWTPSVYTEDGPETLTGEYATEAEAIEQARRFIRGEVDG